MQSRRSCRWWIPSLAMALTLGVADGTRGTTPIVWADVRITAVRAGTGEHLWTSKPLGDIPDEIEVRAPAELAPGARVRATRAGYCIVEVDDGSGGPVTRQTPDASTVVARSNRSWPPLNVRLANGWVLSGFSPGKSRELIFMDPVSGARRWELRLGRHVDNVRVFGDMVLFVVDDILEEHVGKRRIWLEAHAAGCDAPSWSLYLDDFVSTDLRYAEAVHFELLGDRILGQVGEHLFAISPATGDFLWRCDLAADLGLSFQSGWPLNTASIASAGSLLLLGYERRLLAVDLQAGACLWRLELEPAPFPFNHNPLPVAHDGVVYFLSGAKPSPAVPGALMRRIQYMWGLRTDGIVLALGMVVGAAGLGLTVIPLAKRRGSAVQARFREATPS